jgi:hypothetical protein
MRTFLMATVAASMIFTAAAPANAQDHRNDNGRAVVYGIAGLALGLALGAHSHDRGYDDRYYYGRRAYYNGGSPGRPRTYCTGDYYGRECRVYYNGRTPADDYANDDRYEQGYNNQPRYYRQPQVPQFERDQSPSMSPCGLDLNKCMRDGQ